MYSGTKRGVAVMFGLAVSVVGLAPANAATSHDVRQGDFVPSGTSTAGAAVAEFITGGIHLQVKNASTDYAIGVFPVSTLLANVHTVDYVWYGTTSRPGVKYNVDVNGDGTWDCQLVGEQAYKSTTGGSDFVWLNKDPQGVCAPKAPSPTSANTGSGLGDGTLDQWATNMPGAKVVQAGYGASDLVQDGVLSSISLGGDTYTFTNAAVVTPPAPIVPASAGITKSKSSVKHGKSVSFGGSVSPFQAGGRVALQRFYKHKWHLVKAKGLSATGTYRFNFKTSSKGNKYFRVAVAATSKNLASVTRTVKVRVR